MAASSSLAAGRLLHADDAGVICDVAINSVKRLFRYAAYRPAIYVSIVRRWQCERK